jgi:cell division protease FtsH
VVQPVTSIPQSVPTIPTIESMHGYAKARAWGLDLQADLALWREGKLAWDQMSTKLLLSGPPGTGKTTYARALCNTLGVPLVLASVSTWLEPGYLGDVIKRIRLTFEEAAKLEPAVLFIDELDGIGSRGRSRDHDDYWRSLINKLLELLDGALRSEGVIVVGATNDPGNIDPALRRSGRLETHIEIPLPDVDALVGIIEHHLGDDRTAVIASKPMHVANDGNAVPKMGRGVNGQVGENPGRRTAGAEVGRAR